LQEELQSLIGGGASGVSDAQRYYSRILFMVVRVLKLETRADNVFKGNVNTREIAENKIIFINE
jgi:hypothetical protein